MRRWKSGRKTTVDQALDWLLTKAAIKTNGSVGARALCGDGAACAVLTRRVGPGTGDCRAGAATVFSEQPVQASQVERDANLAKRIAQLVRFRRCGMPRPRRRQPGLLQCSCVGVRLDCVLSGAGHRT